MARKFSLLKYNPRNVSLEEIEATFVARGGILDIILSDLHAMASSRTRQHFLITGPRGIGKTNLLLMIRSRVAQDQELSSRYLPVQTAEEEYSIASLRDLIIRVCELLLEDGEDGDLKEWLARAGGANREEEATELLIEGLKSYAVQKGRIILLLVDNLDLILDQQMTDAAEAGRLRDLLMNDDFLVLVGAAPTHFDQVSGYERPFYNFFKSFDLEELPLTLVEELLRKRAAWEGNQAFLDRFEEMRTRIAALYHLTGGNPRLVLVLYQFSLDSEVKELQEAVAELLDDMTPYYKHRLEDLPPQQRRLMDIFARLGRAATPSELAGETRMPLNQVNAVLKRLKECGFVSYAPQKRRKKTYYIVSERLFRIWHQMRYSPASRKKLEFLIEFIKLWYSPADWQAEATKLLGEYRAAVSERGLEEAERYFDRLDYFLEAAPEDESGKTLALDTFRTCLESGDFQHAERLLAEKIDIRSGEQYVQSLVRYGDALSGKARTMSGEEADRLFRQAGEKFAAALAVNPHMEWALNNWGNALAQHARTKSGEEADRLFGQAGEKFAAALAVNPRMEWALNNWGNALADQAQTRSGEEADRLFGQAGEKYAAALAVNPRMEWSLNDWGDALADQARTKSGEEADRLFGQAGGKYAAALAVKPRMEWALNNWGDALYHQALAKTGEEADRLFGQAGEKYAAALAVKPGMHWALNNWGEALYHQALAKTGEEADRLFGQAGEKFAAALAAKAGMHWALNNWGEALYHQALAKTGEEADRLFAQAGEKCAAVLAVKPDMHVAHFNWVLTLLCRARNAEANHQETLYHQTLQKAGEALVAVPEGDVRSKAAKVHVEVALEASKKAIDRNSLAVALSTFRAALTHFALLKTEVRTKLLVDFFRSLASRERAEWLTGCIGVLKENHFGNELGILEPFSIAFDYWKQGENVEVLDRLNPEMRELVEGIIRPTKDKN